MNNFQDKPLALVPHRLFSLWDMIEILPKDFTEIWRQLDAAMIFCAPLSPSDIKQPRQETANPAQQRALADLLTGLWNVCKKWHLQESLFIVNEAREWLVEPSRHAFNDPDRLGAYKFPQEIPPSNFNSVYQQLVSIRTKIHEELNAIRFALVAPETVNYFESSHLFGEAVNKAFPSAATDIKDAGNCLALGLKTASVFHLMRVAEHGLRVLALSPYLKIPPISQIDFASWGDVVQAIDNQVKLIKGTIPRGDAREIELRFYTGLLASARAIQILWRDPVSHIRARFDKPNEAENALQDVHRFMKTLAEKLSE